MKNLILLLALFATPAVSDVVQLNWQLPIEREDNTPLLPEEIANIELYDNQIEVTNFESYPMPGNTISLIITVTVPGTHVYTLRTRDTENRISEDSIAIVYTVLTSPKPPVLLGVTRID
jgi:hypothetical protein